MNVNSGKVNHIGFELKLQTLDKPYIKQWEVTGEDLKAYQEMTNRGNCFGAFDEDGLIGIILAEERSWNNTLYLENVLVVTGNIECQFPCY